MDVLCPLQNTDIDIDVYYPVWGAFSTGDKQTHLQTPLSGCCCNIYSPLIHLNPTLSIMAPLSALYALIECENPP